MSGGSAHSGDCLDAEVGNASDRLAIDTAAEGFNAAPLSDCPPPDGATTSLQLSWATCRFLVRRPDASRQTGAAIDWQTSFGVNACSKERNR